MPAQPTPTACDADCEHHRPVRLSWAKLLDRVFETVVEHCPNWGGKLKTIAAILEHELEREGPEDRLCLDRARASRPWRR